MIDSDGRILCDRCISTRNQEITMARLKGSTLIVWGKHHGLPHEQTIELSEILPAPESEDYASLMADLLRRIPALA